jgi:hypothetical protein
MTGSRRATRVYALVGAAVSLVLGSSISAQVNIEALRRDDPPLGRSGSFNGDLTVRTGNVDFVQVGLAGRHYIVTESLTTLIVGAGGIGLLASSRFASSGLLHFRRTHNFNEWLSPEWYAQTNYDRPQLLRFRVVGGGGIRTAVWRGSWGQFGAGTALMLEHERLDLPDTAQHAVQTTAVRSSTFLTLKVAPNERLVVTSTTYVQPELEDLGDLRILENLRLSSTISERVALTVSFDLRFDSRPPDGIARLDSALRTGLTYTY